MTHAVILAGGWGERLWPMSTRERPKQLLRLTGNSTLVGETLSRIAPIAAADDALVLTSESLREAIARELSSVPSERVIGEPVGRNTAPAIGLAARIVASSDSEGVLVVLPADHAVRDVGIFRSTVELAVGTAASTGALVTLGIVPTRPETEYGYIRVGRASDIEGVFEVESFEEKPDRETASRHIESGGYYWNSGMFVWRADVFLSELARCLPETAAALEHVKTGPGEPGFQEQVAQFYDAVEAISVDYGVMEKAERVLVVPSDFGWDDIGAWPAMARIWGVDGAGNTLRGDVLAIDSSGTIAFAEEGSVAVLGMDDVVVVRTADATLVCPRDRARDVRSVVEELRKKEQ